jgi:hypothetical protein
MSFLGVEKSLTGRRWVGPAIEVDRAAEAIAQQTDLPRPVAQVLARRGVEVADTAAFLEPSLRKKRRHVFWQPFDPVNELLFLRITTSMAAVPRPC